MKTVLFVLALFSVATLAPAADKEDKKNDRKSRTEKDGNKKGGKKEEVLNQFEVVVSGAKDNAAKSDLKTWLAAIEGVKAGNFEDTEDGISVVLSTKAKLSRADITKAVKGNKDLKLTEFKALRPGWDKKDKEKEQDKDGKKDAGGSGKKTDAEK